MGIDESSAITATSDLQAALGIIDNEGSLKHTTIFEKSETFRIISSLRVSGYISRARTGGPWELTETGREFMNKVDDGAPEAEPGPQEPEDVELGLDDETSEPPAERSTATLRETLLDTIDKVLSGDMDVRQAKVVSELSGRVVDTLKLELAYAIAEENINGGIPTGSDRPPITSPLMLEHGN